MSRQLIPREALGYEVPVFSWGKAPGSSAIENRETESGGRASPSPVGGGVKKVDRARQRRKKLARKLAKISPPDHNISLENRAVEGGVKKQQVKGCGSVNRPTPGSQRPAEPVAPGLLQGVKTSKNRGQSSGLGVKRWAVGAGFSQR